MALLSSDSVLRKLVQVMKAPNVLSQDENPAEKEYGVVRGAINTVKQYVEEVLQYLEHPSIRDLGEEELIQRAIANFRRRSAVIPIGRRTKNCGTVL